MRFIVLLCIFVQLLHGLTITHVEGQLRTATENKGEKSFFHAGDTIENGQRLQTGGTAIVHLTHKSKHLILLPSSEYSIYYSDDLLQVTLSKGMLYTIDSTGGTTVNCDNITVTSRGTTAIERSAEQLSVIAIRGGTTIFNEHLNHGELLRKGYKLTIDDSLSQRGFYKDEEIIPLCSILPCEVKRALFCESCPDFSIEEELDDTVQQIVSGELYLHPFVLEADNSFSIPAKSFPQGITRTELFKKIPFTLCDRKEFALYAKRKKEGRTAYYILDGIITPDKNNPNRVLCKLTLYSGEREATILNESIPLFLLDDFSTGGKVIDPLFFEETAKLIMQKLSE